jgi:hypothetical protein
MFWLDLGNDSSTTLLTFLNIKPVITSLEMFYIYLNGEISPRPIVKPNNLKCVFCMMQPKGIKISLQGY